MLVIIFFSLSLTGCTSENHRVMVTIKNNRDNYQNIKVYIDGDQKFTATLDPAQGVEREFEVSKGEHSFDLYHQISGTYELYKTETMYIEADSGIFFELE